ncbi:SDR family NAD(P)-dependent oxidoreductase [Schlesneria paludicola]|uniref:SDR family NAD(P)-dependent oxidoreductase n=1 Tax=Schlesneria paludicola TaxID=360056 RepID=UPI00029B360A|nr:SDR family oxidoreductase [Schlesneria paludicola]
MKVIRGRKALVTGAASGIGRGIALALAREGADLTLWDVDETGLTSLADEIKALGVCADTTRVDLTQPNEITAAVQLLLERSQTIDILVNNAGVAYYGPTHSMTAAQWDWLLGINLLAPIQLTRELLPTLLERPEAHIVNVCSISGLVAGGRFAAYHTSKFGLIGYSEALRAEYGRRGLGVTALCPGPCLTNLYRDCATGKQGKTVPHPPRWLCTTIDTVAASTIKAIRRNHRMPLIGPMAHLLWNIKWLAPGLLDFLNHFRRKRRTQPTGLISANDQQTASRHAA